MKKDIASAAAICVLAFLLGSSFRSGWNIENKVAENTKEIAETNEKIANLTTATILTSRQTWYFMGPGEVSSDPNESGTCVSFDKFGKGDPKYDMCYDLGARRPLEKARLYGRKITFFFSKEQKDHHLVAGRLLDYKLLD